TRRRSCNGAAGHIDYGMTQRYVQAGARERARIRRFLPSPKAISRRSAPAFLHAIFRILHRDPRFSREIAEAHRNRTRTPKSRDRPGNSGDFAPSANAKTRDEVADDHHLTDARGLSREPTSPENAPPFSQRDHAVETIVEALRAIERKDPS